MIGLLWDLWTVCLAQRHDERFLALERRVSCLENQTAISEFSMVPRAMRMAVRVPTPEIDVEID